MWWVFGGKGGAGWGAEEDDIARGEAYGDAVHIDVTGPYEASVGGSVYLIKFVDSTSRWMRPYGIRKTSETTTHVRKFVAGINNMGRPHCFRTDNGG